jgi:ATP-dependent DNA helicase PIF1
MALPANIADAKADALVLNVKQTYALECCRAKKSFFLTGKAGTGKTINIKAIIQDAIQRQKRIAVTATTGLAAILIGGSTIHSWSGMRIGEESLPVLINNVFFSRHKPDSHFERIRNCEILVIDEISQLSAEFATKLHELCKAIRKNTLPFGGIQLIFSGDFYQLGQVNTKPDRESNYPISVFRAFNRVLDRIQHLAFSDDIRTIVCTYWSPTYMKSELAERYLFESEIWKQSMKTSVILTETYRQSDPAFLSLLERARHASLTQADDRLFHLAMGKTINSPFFVPLLHPHNKIVHLENVTRLQHMEGAEFVSRSWLQYRTQNHAPIRFRPNQNMNHFAFSKVLDFANQILVPQVLRLKIGAPIIVVQNIRRLGLANGQRGYVTNIILSSTKSSASRKPLLHKATDLSEFDDIVEVQLENRGERIRLNRHAWTRAAVQSEQHKSQDTWSAYYEVLQFPITLCFALTTHKSQGQSLSAARVCLGKENRSYGQAYVALSRLTKLEGLVVESYDRCAFMTDPAVEDFYKRIEANERRNQLFDEK